MTNVLDFLERMGGDSALRGATGEDLARALSDAGIDGTARQALLSADRAELESLLGASANVFASLHLPGDDTPAEEPPAHDDGDEAPAPARKAPAKKKKKSKKKPAKPKTTRKPAKKKAPKKPARKKGGKKKAGKKKAAKKK